MSDELTERECALIEKLAAIGGMFGIAMMFDGDLALIAVGAMAGILASNGISAAKSAKKPS